MMSPAIAEFESTRQSFDEKRRLTADSTSFYALTKFPDRKRSVAGLVLPCDDVELLWNSIIIVVC
jgi:hypothetical protein